MCFLIQISYLIFDLTEAFFDAVAACEVGLVVLEMRQCLMVRVARLPALLTYPVDLADFARKVVVCLI